MNKALQKVEMREKIKIEYLNKKLLIIGEEQLGKDPILNTQSKLGFTSDFIEIKENNRYKGVKYNLLMYVWDFVAKKGFRFVIDYYLKG
ncbi:MAG: hypothetical protein JXA68_08485, partial [Ignavibacteriales bacterium]|nr:hypothetical protein [Ignavibacteriales bacterium]